jgi:hypothetical protein
MQEQNTEIVPEQSGEQAPEVVYTEIQLKAIDQGWIPKDDFDGDESEFIDAAEFVRRGELFKKIETQSKEVKALRQALESFKVHHSKVKEAEYERALKTLQSARKDAVINGEHEQAFALEEKIDEIKAEKAMVVAEGKAPVVQDDVGYTAEFQAWVDKNSWYENNKVMRATADALGVAYHKEGFNPAEVLRKVANDIREEFKDKFKKQSSERTMAVEPSTRTGSNTRASEVMTSEEREIMRQIVRMGGITEAEYIKELKNAKAR